MPPQDPAGDLEPVRAGGAHVVDRLELAAQGLDGRGMVGGRRRRRPRARPRPPGPGSASRRPSRARSGRRASARIAAPGGGHHDLARSPAPGACRPCGTAWRPVVDERDPDAEQQLVRPERGLAGSAGQNSAAGIERSPAGRPTTSVASSASSTGSVSPGRRGVHRRCRRACRGSGSGPRRSSRRPRPAPARARAGAERRICGVGRQRAELQGRRRDAMPRSSSSRHRSMTRSGARAELAGELDHQVGAAGDGPVRRPGQDRVGLARGCAARRPAARRASAAPVSSRRRGAGRPRAAIASTILV